MQCSREFGGGSLEVILDVAGGDAARVDVGTWVGSLLVGYIIICLIENEASGEDAQGHDLVRLHREDTQNMSGKGSHMSTKSNRGIGQIQPLGALEVVGKVIVTQFASHPALGSGLRGASVGGPSVAPCHYEDPGEVGRMSGRNLKGGLDIFFNIVLSVVREGKKLSEAFAQEIGKRWACSAFSEVA
jgi:hypothetical protein